MKTRSFLISALAAVTLASSNAAVIIGNNADATPQDRLNSLSQDISDGIGDSIQDLDKSDGTVRAGSFATAFPSRRAAVFVFELPTRAVFESISTADFSVRLFSRQNSPAYNVDLWALRTSASSTVLASDYGAGTTPSGPSGQTLIQDNFATTSSSTVNRLSTNASADIALTSFLNANWINGGFLFLRGTVDGDALTFSTNGSGGTLAQGYDFGAANRSTDAERPQLDITVIPEPSTVALLVAAGTSTLFLRRRRA